MRAASRPHLLATPLAPSRFGGRVREGPGPHREFRRTNTAGQEDANGQPTSSKNRVAQNVWPDSALQQVCVRAASSRERLPIVNQEGRARHRGVAQVVAGVGIAQLGAERGGATCKAAVRRSHSVRFRASRAELCPIGSGLGKPALARQHIIGSGSPPSPDERVECLVLPRQL